MVRTLSAALLLVAAICAAGSPPDQALEKDLRAPGSKSTLTVVLCARSGVPGHAMVVLGKDDEKQRACTVHAFGFYPNGGAGVLGPVPGKIADEFREGRGLGGSGACRIILRVDPKQFEKVESVHRRWSEKKDYRVLQSDCVTFVGEVAATLGLKVPDRSQAKLPTTFVERLRELNR
jgi:hypothetical protein